uniref:Uncharacterized protein n=1 Tax=Eutreptiella gymnastica TaxID=73025 RepID=A0A7S4LDT4_9EUGL
MQIECQLMRTKRILAGPAPLPSLRAGVLWPSHADCSFSLQTTTMKHYVLSQSLVHSCRMRMYVQGQKLMRRPRGISRPLTNPVGFEVTATPLLLMIGDWDGPCPKQFAEKLVQMKH